MFQFKKENISGKDVLNRNQAEVSIEDNIKIHTMQDDFNSLSGIFSKQNTPVLKQEQKSSEISPKNGEKKENQYFNPFLGQQDPKALNSEKEADFKPQNPIQSIPVDNTLIEKSTDLSKQKSNFNFFWIAVIVFVILFFSAGGYYFWTLKKTKTQQSISETKTEEPASQETVKIEEPEIKKSEFKYSSDKPNYLSIDMKNPSYENLKGVLTEAALEVKAMNAGSLVEFIITDKNNNPIAFSEFAVLSKIKLSSELLKDLGNNFSLYINTDSGNTRLALAIDTNNKEKSVLAIKSEENRLVQELMPLFLDQVPNPSGKIFFSDNNYKEVKVRYFNLLPNGMASIDYGFLNNQMIIATSKISMWSVIDKIKSENSN